MLRTLRAFAYLTWNTQRNRTLTRVRRTKNPRYAISAVIGAVYFWFFLVHNTSQLPRDAGSMFSDGIVVLGMVGLVLFASSWWLFGGDKTTLTFSLAETAFLFTAPLSRRAVIGYKLFRAQLTILINAVIFIFLLRRGVGFLPSGYRAISLWVLFTTMNFHRVGAALVRASWVEHKVHGWRRNVLPALALATLIIGVAVAGTDGWPVIRAALHDKGFFDAVATARTVLEQPPANIVLWPIHAIIAPVFAHTRHEWALSIPAALLVLALHAWWVVRMDAAFEEASIAASVDRVKLIESWRTRRIGPKTDKISRKGLRIPTWGHPAVAIVWKNILCLRRTLQLRIFIAPTVMAVSWGMFFVSLKGPAAGVAIGAATFAGLFSVFGPMLVRNDLRQDMQNIAALKTLPLRGSTIVLAEVMSSAIPVAVLQFATLAIAAVASLIMRDPLPTGLVIGTFAVAFPALLTIASVMVAVQNGAPVLFPGWVRIGVVVGGGMENLGQGVMSMGIILILVALLLIAPLALAGGLLFVGQSLGWGVIVPLALLVGSATLAFETYAVFEILGRALERTEPSETAVA